MRKALALVLFAAAVPAGVGCGSLQYVQQTSDGGVVAFKAGDEQATIEKLKKEHGDVDVVAVYDPKAGGKPFDPNAPVRPSERMAASGPLGALVASDDGNTMHLKFTKKAGATPIGTTPAGLPPAPKDDGLVQAGFTSKSGYDRKPGGGTALPHPNMAGVGGPIQGVVDCTDGTCTTGR
jgi:hypothetical protein